MLSQYNIQYNTYQINGSTFHCAYLNIWRWAACSQKRNTILCKESLSWPATSCQTWCPTSPWTRSTSRTGCSSSTTRCPRSSAWWAPSWAWPRHTLASRSLATSTATSRRLPATTAGCMAVPTFPCSIRYKKDLLIVGMRSDPLAEPLSLYRWTNQLWLPVPRSRMQGPIQDCHRGVQSSDSLLSVGHFRVCHTGYKD